MIARVGDVHHALRVHSDPYWALQLARRSEGTEVSPSARVGLHAVVLRVRQPKPAHAVHCEIGLGINELPPRDRERLQELPFEVEFLDTTIPGVGDKHRVVLAKGKSDWL